MTTRAAIAEMMTKKWHALGGVGPVQSRVIRGMRIKTRAKYGNRKTEIGGITFDSQREAERYRELKLLERTGFITGLELQPRFAVVIEGRTVCTYKADFRYREACGGKEIVEDVKGVRTPVYRLKKKLVEAVHGVEIKEI